MQVAARPHLEVDHRMAAEAFEHVVEEADARIDIAIARPVEVEGNGYLGLAGFPFDGGSAHGQACLGFVMGSYHRGGMGQKRRPVDPGDVNCKKSGP